MDNKRSWLDSFMRFLNIVCLFLFAFSLLLNTIALFDNSETFKIAGEFGTIFLLLGVLFESITRMYHSRSERNPDKEEETEEETSETEEN